MRRSQEALTIDALFGPVVIEFEVMGEPEPKGSARALIGKDGRAFVIADNARSKVWERAVKLVASRVAPAEPLDCPLRLEVEFTVTRPQKPRFDAPAVRPDLDKYLRSTGDAMTGVLYTDDSRIVEIAASKKFGATPGAWIRVSTIEGAQLALIDETQEGKGRSSFDPTSGKDESLG